MGISIQKRIQLIALCRSAAQQLLDAYEPMKRGDFLAMPEKTFNIVIGRLMATGCVTYVRGGHSGQFGSYKYELDDAPLTREIFARIADSDEDAARVLWPPEDEEPSEVVADAATEPTAEEVPETAAQPEQLVELIAGVLQGFKASIDGLTSKMDGYGKAFIELTSFVGKQNAERAAPVSVDESIADLALAAVIENTESVKSLKDKTAELAAYYHQFARGHTSLQAERDQTHTDMKDLMAEISALRADLANSQKADLARHKEMVEVQTQLVTAINEVNLGATGLADGITTHSAQLRTVSLNQEELGDLLVAFSTSVRRGLEAVLDDIGAVSRGVVLGNRQLLTPAEASSTSAAADNVKTKNLMSLSAQVMKKDKKKLVDKIANADAALAALPDSIKNNLVDTPLVPMYSPMYGLAKPPSGKEDKQ